jgi:hypothetical protein
VSQYDFGIIDPYVVDGVQLATMLNNWRDALYSMQRGPTRPGFMVPGQLWIDDSAGSLLWQVKLYVGPTIGDVMLYTINTEDGTVVFNKDVIGDFLPTSGGTINGNLAVTGTLNVANQAAFAQSVSAKYRFTLTGDASAGAITWYDPTQPADQKNWDAYSGGGMWSLRAVNDAYSATQNPINISRAGYAITRIDHNSPIHYWFSTTGVLYGQWDAQGLLAPSSDIGHEFFVGRYNASFGYGVINARGNYPLQIQASGNLESIHFSGGYSYVPGPPIGDNSAAVPNTNWVLQTMGAMKAVGGGLINADGSYYFLRGCSSVNHYGTGQWRFYLSPAMPSSAAYNVMVTVWGANGALVTSVLNQTTTYFDINLVNVVTVLGQDYPFSFVIFMPSY